MLLRNPLSHNQLVAAVFVLFACLPGKVRGQQPDMSNVNDVLSGKRTILQIDDVVTVQSFYDTRSITDPAATARVSFLNSSKSQLANPAIVPNFQYRRDATADVYASALGWMYNAPNQIVALFSAPGVLGSNDFWYVDLYNPKDGATWTSNFAPAGQDDPPVPQNQQIFMGDFAGTGYDQALLLFSRGIQGFPTMTLSMRVASASDPNTIGSPLTFGPRVDLATVAYGAPGIQPQVAVGDFNGDGRKDIAVMPNGDGKTILFFTVQPDLSLVQVTTLQLTEQYLGVSLAAGHFVSSQHDDLVAVGQVSGGTTGLTIAGISMQIQNQQAPNPPTFTPILTKETFVDAGQKQGDITIRALAQAAPLVDWSSNQDQLLVVNNTETDYGAHLTIGTFDVTFAFTKQSDTSVTDGHAGCVYSMTAGNFDSLDSAGAHLPNLSVATYSEGDVKNCKENSDHKFYVRVWPVNTQTATDWLGKPFQVETPNTAGEYQGASMVVGDLQGRSLRLGQPEKVTLDQNIQTDVALSLPPMHADWIVPLQSLNNRPGCTLPSVPCQINLTVVPTSDLTGGAFSTQFAFQSGSSSNSQRKSTTSWSVGVKQEFSASVTLGIPDEDSISADFKQSFAYTHDNTVSKTYNTYTSQTDQLSIATGFADNILFTSQRLNVYYYPVIGQTVCPASKPGCGAADKVQACAVFSVPDQVTHYQTDATTQEWYQPVHEPANVFSYPANYSQLQAEFPGASALTQNPAPVQATDTSASVYTSTWAGSDSGEKSTGSVNSFAEGVGLTVSGAASDLITTSKTSLSVDVNSSQSFGSLNVLTQTLSASEGIAVNKPGFTGDFSTCCVYEFSSYVAGVKPPTDIFQNLDLKGQNGQPLDIKATGPLYVGFTANPFPSSGGYPWWAQAYTLPDVGLSHPARWTWDGTAKSLTFNKPQATAPEDDPFYQMKGFFITNFGAAVAGRNLSTARAGDKLTLTARVYNFSPVPVNAANAVYVAFYGQEWDHTQHAPSGDAFPIEETTTAPIPGFDSSSNTPNWSLVSTTKAFDTTPHAGKYLIFWVVVQIVDANFGLATELPGHGLLNSAFGKNFTAITQVPVEPYSNNVGMYGVYSPFYVASAPALGATQEPEDGTIVADSLRLLSKTLLLNKRVDMLANVTTKEQAAKYIKLTYFDGKPGKNGKAFGFQPVTHIPANSNYLARYIYEPKSCGVHNLYLVAERPGSTSTYGPVQENVTIDPTASIQSMITDLSATNVSKKLTRTLSLYLSIASTFFSYGDEREGKLTLKFVILQARALRGRALTAEQADRLIDGSQQIIGCLQAPDKRGRHIASAVPAGEGELRAFLNGNN